MNHFEYPPQTPEHAQLEAAMQPDLERLTQTAARFGDRIDQGIAEAERQQREASRGTARLIGHVLGRAYGRHSNLANFGRTGGGTYSELRDECLDLYSHPGTSSQVQHWIDWLGTRLIQAENHDLPDAPNATP